MVSYLKRSISSNRIVFFFFLSLIFTIYGNSLSNTLVVDDIVAINNPKVFSFSSVTEHPFGFVQPLVYFVTAKIFGPNATAFRLVNIIFHTGMVWMIFLLFSTMKNRVVALLTASLFAVHPALIESTTWISGGSYTKYSFFIIASLLFYVRSHEKKFYIWLSIFFYFLALNTFEKAIVFPAILFTYELALGDIKSNWKRLIPFLVLSIFFGLAFIFPEFITRTETVQKISGSGPAINNPLILIPYALSSYLSLIVWPYNLSLYHPHSTLSVVNYIMRLSMTLLFSGSLIYFFKKNRLIFFWLSFFVISISYTFFPIKLFWIVAERYAYLGSVGVIFVVGYAISKLTEKEITKSFGWAIFIVISITLMARTIVRNFDWKNSETLWLATVKSYPNYYQGHYSLGVEYEEQGRLDEARKEYEVAIKLNPKDSRAYANLGSVYLKKKDLKKSFEISSKALKLNPWAWEPYQNIGVIYYLKGSYDNAEQYTKKAIQRLPKNSDIYAKAGSELYFNLGSIFFQKGEKDKGREAFAKSLEIDPRNERAKKILQDSKLWTK